MGDRVFFSATDGATGTEVWVSDGTFAGTTVTLDINPGAAGSSPSNFVGIGNRLFFSAAIPATGREPWCSDGTPAGTVMLGDLNPGGDSFPAFFVGLNGMVLFSAFTPAQGTELWRTDGTPAGTSLFVEIRPGPLGSSPRPLGVIGNELLFAAADDSHGYEIWATDGTVAGTRLVKDINPGSVSSIGTVVSHVAPDGSLLFEAITPATGSELYRASLDTTRPRLRGVKKRRATDALRIRLKGRVTDDLYAGRVEYRLKRPGAGTTKWRKTKLRGKGPEEKRWVLRLALRDPGAHVVRLRAVDGNGNVSKRKRARITRI